MSAPEYAYVGPPNLFLHWAQICLKQAVILNINDLGMCIKGLKYHRLKRTDIYIALSVTASGCKKMRCCASKQDSVTVHNHLNTAERFMAI